MPSKAKGGVREGSGRKVKPGVRLAGKISLEADKQLSALQALGADSCKGTFTRIAAIEWAIGELYRREIGEENKKGTSD